MNRRLAAHGKLAMAIECYIEIQKILDFESSNPCNDVDKEVVGIFTIVRKVLFFLCVKRRTQMLKFKRQEWKVVLGKKKDKGFL